MEWLSVMDRIPPLGDYSVLVYFEDSQAIDMVHVEEYFADITNGRINGILQYTKWYKSQNVTHWMYLPEIPE